MSGARILSACVAVGELLCVPLAFFFAVMGVMMFDAPGSTERSELWLAFFAAWALPIALLVGAGFAVAAAIRYTRRRLAIALILPSLAALWLIVALAML